MCFRDRHPARRAFTVIELLIVVAIIITLAVLLVATWPLVRERMTRLRCQVNLAKCHRVMTEYGANNNGYLPPMSGANGMGMIQYQGIPRHYVVEELKEYGASAAIFTCPATDDYDNPKSAAWNSWTKPRVVTQSSTQVLQVNTSGYVFFIGFWPWLESGRRHYSYFYGAGAQPFADRVDSPGNPPLGADRMGYFPNYQYGKTWNGWHHQENTELDAPGGGGHTLWLDGTIEWAYAAELLEQAEATPPIQPIWWGAWPQWTYLARWRPSEEGL
jgi:type II secretory pathway pseudopilin PulG